MNKTMKQLPFKQYPHMGQLVKKITKNDCPDNVSFDYYNTMHVDVQRGTDDYMNVTIRETKHNSTIAEINFDYLTMDVDINYAQTNDIAMNIIHSFRQAYPNDNERLKFNLNKTNEIFTQEDYQEISSEGFKCNLINL